MIHLTSPWIIFPVILPLCSGILCFILPKRKFQVVLLSTVLTLLSTLTLIKMLFLYGPIQYSIGGWSAPLGINLRLDGPSALMLIMTSVTGIGITLYARGYFTFRISKSTKRAIRHTVQQHYFWPLWMFLHAGVNALFLSSDIFNIYVSLELISVSAVSLTALSGKPSSLIAAFRYLLVSVLGSLCYLLGVVFIYRKYAILDLVLLQDVISINSSSCTALALISVGMLLKTALFPLHFWLPPAHANALAPVSAILSGLVVKSSFYLLFRFWFEIFAALITRQALTLIGALGACAILWGAMQAIRQQRLKLLIAYSTISQLGYLFVAFPLIKHDNETLLWSAVSFMVLSHAFAKSAMFMAAGTIFLHTGHDRIKNLAGVRKYLPVSTFAYSIAGVSMMGLPPSGGFISKWILLRWAIDSTQWWWAVTILIGSLLASIYVFQVVSRLFIIPDFLPHRKVDQRSSLQQWPAFVLACFSLFLGLLAPVLLHILSIENGIMLTSLGGIP